VWQLVVGALFYLRRQPRGGKRPECSLFVERCVQLVLRFPALSDASSLPLPEDIREHYLTSASSCFCRDFNCAAIIHYTIRQQMPCTTAVMLDERTIVFTWFDSFAGFNERKESDARVDVFAVKSAFFSTDEFGPRNASFHTPVCLNPLTIFDLVGLLKYALGWNSQNAKRLLFSSEFDALFMHRPSRRDRNSVLNGANTM
jgi:hypothetical protein